MNFKEKLLNIVLQIYSWFFKTKPTKEIKIFVESLLFVFIATGIAKALLFIMNILGGRFLGPTLYGEYTLLVSISSFLMIPIGFAVQGGVMKYLADVQDTRKRKRVISTAFSYFGITLIFFTVLYIILHKWLASILHMGSTIFFLAIALTVFWTTNALFELILKSLHRQKTWSYLITTSYILAFALFIGFIAFKQYNLLLLFLPTLLIYAVFAVAGGFMLKKYYTITIFDKKEFKKMFNYGFFVFIITIATTFLGNVDKVMLNLFLGAESVGIYQAYFLSSIMIIGVLMGVFVNVFAPTAIKLKDAKGMIKKLDKIVLIGGALLIVGIPIIQFIVLFLYNYPFVISRSLLFMIATIITVGTVLYSVLLDVQSLESIKRSSLGVIIAFLVNIPLNYFLIPLWGINGAIIATGISYFLLLIYIRYTLVVIIRKQNVKA